MLWGGLPAGLASAALAAYIVVRRSRRERVGPDSTL